MTPIPTPREASPARALIERAIETLVAVLDALDADPDAEPSLGSPTGPDQRHWAEGDRSDREEQADAEPDHLHEDCTWQDEGDQTRLSGDVEN